MFDRTFITESRGPSHVTVNEHKAPTDASVKLLADLEQKVRDKVFGQVKLESNTFHCEVMRMMSPFRMGETLAITMKLNGERILMEITPDPFASEEDKLREIYKAVAKRIAAHIATSVVKATWRSA
jgi:hypothetical protein